MAKKKEKHALTSRRPDIESEGSSERVASDYYVDRPAAVPAESVQSKLTGREQFYCRLRAMGVPSLEASKKAQIAEDEDEVKLRRKLAKAAKAIEAKKSAREYIQSIKAKMIECAVTGHYFDGQGNFKELDIDKSEADLKTKALRAQKENPSPLTFKIPEYGRDMHIYSVAAESRMLNALTHLLYEEYSVATSDPIDIFEIKGGRMIVKDMDSMPPHVRRRIVSAKNVYGTDGVHMGVEIKVQNPAESRRFLMKFMDKFIRPQSSGPNIQLNVDQRKVEGVQEDARSEKGLSLRFRQELYKSLAAKAIDV